MYLKNFLFLALLAMVLVAGCAQQQSPPPQQAPPTTTETGAGTLIVSITDNDSYQQEFSAINLMIDKIELQKSGGDWVLFFSGQKTFNILELATEKKLIAQKEIAAGNYSGLRFSVSGAEIVKNDGTKNDISVPSEKMVLEKNFSVKKSKALELTIDFDPYAVVLLDGSYLLQPNEMLLKLLDEQEYLQKVALRKQEQKDREDQEYKVVLDEFVYQMQAKAGDQIGFSWKVAGGKEGKVPHTAVHWDLAGGHGANIEEYANVSEILEGQTPQVFSTKITAPDSDKDVALFFRFHAVVDGMHYYSDELQVKVMAKETVQAQTKEFTVTSTDSKFDPSEIIVSQGDLVKITFNVPTSGVSFGGEDIRSGVFNTGVVVPGTSKIVEFTAPDQGFDVKSFWPRSSVQKATLKVTVQ